MLLQEIDQIKELLRSNDKSLARNKSSSQRSIGASSRHNTKSKNQISYSNPRKQRHMMNSTKRRYNFGSNESSRNKLNDSKTSAISSMVYKIGNKHATKINTSSHIPLSPRVNESFKQYLFSNEKHGLLRK